MKKIIWILLITSIAFSANLLKTIKPTGGDYTSLQACIAANGQDLVANGVDTFKMEISGDWTTARDSTATDITGFATNATHIIYVYCTGSALHSGAFDSTKYFLRMKSGAAGLSIHANYVTIKGLQFRAEGDQNAIRCFGTNPNKIINCIFVATNATNSARAFYCAGGGSKTYFVNCIAARFKENGFLNNGSSDTVIAYNCTAYNCVSAFNNGNGGRFLIINCLENGYGTNRSGGTFDSTSDYYATNYTSAPTVTGSTNTHGRISKPFTFVDSANNNFQLASTDTGGRDYGADLSSDTKFSFAYDVANNARPYNSAWDIGASEYSAGGCSAPTITRHATITDTIGNSGRYGHSIGGGTADSTKRIGTWPDSTAMIAYTTKDTVAYKWKKKQAMTGHTIRAYGCSDSATAIDSIAIIGPSVAYSTSPRVDTTGRAAINQDVTSSAMADSFTLASALPAGLSLTKSGANLGRISGTPTTVTSKTGYKVYVWRKDVKADSAFDTLSVIRGLALDSVRPATVRAGDTTYIYGSLFGASQGSSTVAYGDSTPTVWSWAAGLLKVRTPNFPDTGHYDFIMSDGVQACTLVTAIKYDTGPTITAQPANDTVITGQAAAFSISATGTGTLSYQWYKNGSTAGTNSSTYTYTVTTVVDPDGVTAFTADSVRCNVTDANGSTMSTSAYVRAVSPLPYEIYHMIGQSNGVGIDSLSTPKYTTTGDSGRFFEYPSSTVTWPHIVDPIYRSRGSANDGLANASCAPSFATAYYNQYGRSVGIYPGAFSGYSYLEYWYTNGVTFQGTIAAKRLYSRSPAGLIGIGGESDQNANGLTVAGFKGVLDTLIMNFRDSMNDQNLPFYYSVPWYGTDITFAKCDTVLNAMIDWDDSTKANKRYAFCYGVVLAIRDNVHWTRASEDKVGKMLLQAIKYHKGDATWYHGPRLGTPQWASKAKTCIRVPIAWAGTGNVTACYNGGGVTVKIDGTLITNVSYGFIGRYLYIGLPYPITNQTVSVGYVSDAHPAFTSIPCMDDSVGWPVEPLRDSKTSISAWDHN